MRKSCRGGRSRHGEKPKELPFGSPLGQYKFIFYSPHPNRWNKLIEGGYTLPTKTLPTSRHIRLGFSVVVLQGLPRSPQSSMLSMPTATPHAVLVRSGSTFWYGLSPLPNGGLGTVSRGTRIFEDCRSAFPLTPILYHTQEQMSMNIL